MFTIDTSTRDSIQFSFQKAAEDLFNHRVLVVGDQYFRFLEIEFYYRNESSGHVDNYSHQHDEQLKTGTWYFHGSGLDITFGSEDPVIHAGVLIRSIQHVNPRAGSESNKANVFGPLKVITTIFSHFPAVRDSTPFSFYLHDLRVSSLNGLTSLEEEAVYKATRIGLNENKDKDKEKYFHKATYRFLIHPHLGHKDKTGIAEQLYKERHTDPDALDEIRILMGSEFLKHRR
jgi:3-methyladenine DNA glycosylase Mpg